jgi:8-oxo-dGTP pyrophosphatase MutT (NUDIX family)
MSHRNELLEALRAYTPESDKEKSDVVELIEFIEANKNCFDRSNLSGHVTGSCWLINPEGNKALLTHHKALNRWLQLGGHSDGDSDTWNVSLREAQEESGIDDINFVSRDVFDVDVHSIPASSKRNEAEHKHYDVRFLLRAKTEDFAVRDESNTLQWFSSNELTEMSKVNEIDLSVQRLNKKWDKLTF